MELSKEQIETTLKTLLNDLLEHGNQDHSIKSLTYNKETETCTVEMDVVIIEEPEYVSITFAGY